PGFGTSFHRLNPWFNESRNWVRYLQRSHLMLQQGNPAADVAVYIGDFTPQMTGPGNPVPAGYDFDYIGSDAILHNLDVVDGKWVVYDQKDRKKIAATYELLTLPNAGYVRPQVLKRLEELKQAGGKIPASGAGQALQQAGIAPMVSETTGGVRWKVRQLDNGMIFFLSNFGGPGKFEAKLRVTGKVPELFNPVTGEVRKLARYKEEKDGTRICIDVNDPADSFFVVFREAAKAPSVVKVELDGKEVGPGDLALSYDAKNRLVAESRVKGAYALTMSDGTTKSVTIDQDSATLPVAGEWASTNKDEKGFSVFKEISFSVPAGFGKGQKVELDLGKVEVMAQVTLNGKDFETLWMPPFVLDVTDVVKSGNNKLKVLVTSTVTGKPALGDVQLRATSTQSLK
ncbi:MAG TPA: glycosyl hydrolase, partial [Luteolibacter sp.]|nr:glycosyl hydrolase [Luteolibacter sp.]